MISFTIDHSGFWGFLEPHAQWRCLDMFDIDW
jgi:hypothetical protein